MWLKWPEHETYHSTSSSAEVKNEWSYTSPVLYAFMTTHGQIYFCFVRENGFSNLCKASNFCLIITVTLWGIKTSKSPHWSNLKCCSIFRKQLQSAEIVTVLATQ